MGLWFGMAVAVGVGAAGMQVERLAVPAAAVAAAKAEREDQAFEIAAPKAEQCLKSVRPRARCFDLLVFAAEQTPMMEAKRGEGFAQAALRIAESGAPKDHPDLLRALEARARSIDQKGPDYSDADCGGRCPRRWKDAEPFYRRAIALRARILPDRHAELARLRQDLAGNLYGQERASEARGEELAAIDLLEAGLPATSGPLNRAFEGVIYSLEERMEYAAAEPLRRRHAALVERQDAGEAFAGELLGIAGNLVRQGRFVDAEPIARRAADLLLALPGGQGELRAYWALIAILEPQQRFAEVEPLLRRIVALEAADPAMKPERRAEIEMKLAETIERQGRFAEAEPLRRAMVAQARVWGGTGAQSMVLGFLADNLDAQGRLAEAEALHRQSLLLARADTGFLVEIPRGEALRRLAGNLDSQNRFAEAEPLYREGMAFWLKTAPFHYLLAPFHAALAANLEAQGKFAAAVAERRRALAIWSNRFGLAHPDRIAATLDLARFHVRRGSEGREARSAFRQAAQGALDRAAAFRDFGPGAQAELARYRPIFTGQVAANWALAASQPRAAR